MSRIFLFSAVISVLISVQTPGLPAIEYHKRSWYLPDVLTLQTAGYIGYIAGGIGFLSFKRVWETSFFYGYVPSDIGGRKISTVAWKNSIYPLKFSIGQNLEISPLYFGISVLAALDKDLYWEKSTDAPDGYYAPTGLHAIANLGIQMSLKSCDFIHGFYAELTMLDTYAKAYFWDDSDYLAFRDCVSLAFGYKIIFN